MCAQGGPLLLSVVEVAVVAGDPLLGGVDGEPGIYVSSLVVGGGEGLAIVGLGGGRVAVTLAL